MMCKPIAAKLPWFLAVMLALVGMSLSSCTPGADLQPLPMMAGAEGGYRLGSGDKLRVITFGQEQLTGDFNVDDAGGVSMPLVGVVHASGLTPLELAAKIEDELRGKNLFVDPSVSVEVTKYRPIFLLGEVTRPGEYPFQPGMTLLSAVSVAGGFTYRGIQDYASIVRSAGDKVVEGKVGRQALIQPGDVITIFERRF
jgi:polysaccharide export outer membrane protein